MKLPPAPGALDLAVAAGVAVVAVAEVASNPQIQPRAGALVIELALAAVVAWRRSAPVAAAALVALGVVAEAVVGVPPSEAAVPPIACVIVLYSLVSYTELRRAVIGSAVLVLAATAQVVLGRQSPANLFFIYGLLGFAWAFGRMVRLRTTQAVSAELAVVKLHRERDEQRRRVAEEERARIARELHDVIAHSVSVMVVQAGAAQRMLDRDEAAVRRALETIQDTGRQAVSELARMLGVLRAPGDASENLAPMPTLAELPRLVEAAAQTGPRATLRVLGESRPLSSSLELTVYRIVQEALTNTRKHAGPDSAAIVTLTYRQDSLELEVVDDGVGDDQTASGTGHGLVGIRERVGSHHGTVCFDSVPGRGFRVQVWLPIECAP